MDTAIIENIGCRRECLRIIYCSNIHLNINQLVQTTCVTSSKRPPRNKHQQLRTALHGKKPNKVVHLNILWIRNTKSSSGKYLPNLKIDLSSYARHQFCSCLKCKASASGGKTDWCLFKYGFARFESEIIYKLHGFTSTYWGKGREASLLQVLRPMVQWNGWNYAPKCHAFLTSSTLKRIATSWKFGGINIQSTSQLLTSSVRKG